MSLGLHANAKRVFEDELCYDTFATNETSNLKKNRYYKNIWKAVIIEPTAMKRYQSKAIDVVIGPTNNQTIHSHGRYTESFPPVSR